MLFFGNSFLQLSIRFILFWQAWKALLEIAHAARFDQRSWALDSGCANIFRALRNLFPLFHFPWRDLGIILFATMSLKIKRLFDGVIVGVGIVVHERQMGLLMEEPVFAGAGLEIIFNGTFKKPPIQ
jgi:hypothetical protein